MRKLCMFSLLAAALVLSSNALAKCVSNGYYICKQASAFTSWLNSNNPSSGKHFRVSRAESGNGSIRVHFTYVDGKDGLEAMLVETKQTQAEFERKLQTISRQAACKEPARGIVINGGSFTAIYEYPDRTQFFEYTAGSC